MAVVRELRPRGPYDLALLTRHVADATRRVGDGGVLTAVVWRGGEPVTVAACQRRDGSVIVRAADDEALERARFMLGLDDDHTEFLRRFARDPLLGVATRRLRGLRPIRVDTVVHALLRALCGQLVDWRTAQLLERRIVRAVSPRVGELHAPPTGAVLARYAAPELRALGLHARRAATLVRLCRSLELERLRGVPTPAVAARLGRERGVGPWSVGVVCLHGLGRYDAGLVGDLGLVKLLAEQRGRRVEGWETEELLAPYGEWAGLASVYLLAAYGAGLLPSLGRRRRGEPVRVRVATASARAS